MTTGVRCPFIELQLPPAGSCVCIICGHLEDNPRHPTGQQRQSCVSDKIFFSFSLPSKELFKCISHVLLRESLRKPWDFSVELLYDSS